MPVLVRLRRLLEAGAFARRRRGTTVKHAGLTEHAIDRRRTGCEGVCVEAHERQAPVPFEWMLLVKTQYCSALVGLEPVVAGDVAVVFIGFTVALLPFVELAAGDAEPSDEALGGLFTSFGPVVDEVDDLIAQIVGNPSVL